MMGMSWMSWYLGRRSRCTRSGPSRAERQSASWWWKRWSCRGRPPESWSRCSSTGCPRPAPRNGQSSRNHSQTPRMTAGSDWVEGTEIAQRRSKLGFSYVPFESQTLSNEYQPTSDITNIMNSKLQKWMAWTTTECFDDLHQIAI